MKYDLEERTAKFAESIIQILRQIKISSFNSRIFVLIFGKIVSK